MTEAVKKAVFPVAGLGTRFLPATKANPKEMLPIVDKPLIQYAAEEAEAAGITELIFVTGRNKWAIPDHFDKAYELEAELEKKNKADMLEVVRNVLPPKISCMYIRQSEPLGLGQAVLCAKPAVGDEPFAVLLADDLIDGKNGGCLSQMAKVHERYECGIIAVQTIPKEETDKYGIVESQPMERNLSRITGIVEKPDPAVAPSVLAVVGRYILPPEIMDLLEQTERGAGGEIQLTDAIARLLDKRKVLAWEFEGKRYDCGSKLGYLQATVEYALKHAELKDDFASYLKTIRLD
jgi:UTP--glucose-1-phosphate uridylyltransferase